MAKKRKASARGGDESKGPNMDVGESRKRIRTYEDVADSDDEFHLNRDKVSLDEAPDVKRRRKQREQEEFLDHSDEEVLAQLQSEDEDAYEDAVEGHDAATGGASSQSEQEDGEDEDEEGWGTTRADLYGADEIETEEQALEEEAEALRLQKKQLQDMSAADYGFDESEWQDAGDDETGKQGHATVTEVLPQLQIAEDLSAAERLKLLKSRYPEFEPLSKDLLKLREIQNGLSEEASTAASYGLPYVPNAVTRYRAASAYTGALTMYFALLSSTAPKKGGANAAMSAGSLRDHPLMDSLVKCRDLWQRVQSLPSDPAPIVAQPAELDDEQLEASDDADTAVLTNGKKRQRKSRAQRHADAVQEAANARKAERIKRTEASFGSLDALTAPTTTTKRRKPQPKLSADDSDLGEEAPLTAQEAAEKAQKKKSLRFYTSQIAQKANKRGAAGRGAGGDDDVPHRERLKDRQARLNAEAEKRGSAKQRVDIGDDLGGSSDEEDATQAQQLRSRVDNEDDYYDLVASKTQKKKTEKAALAEAQKQAALQGGQVVQEEVIGEDGKRKITYLIEKNKGLTPHRKKDVRNPRVKKRKKFEEKKKKLASMKPVYKGGEGRGGYGGELTGIKKGLVKSTKL